LPYRRIFSIILHYIAAPMQSFAFFCSILLHRRILLNYFASSTHYFAASTPYSALFCLIDALFCGINALFCIILPHRRIILRHRRLILHYFASFGRTDATICGIQRFFGAPACDAHPWWGPRC
jgi:hypothetical protein